MIPDRVWCFFGQHAPVMTRRHPLTVVWVCRHCLRELGRTEILRPPTMSPLKVERLRNLIRRTNEREARRRGE